MIYDSEGILYPWSVLLQWPFGHFLVSMRQAIVFHTYISFICFMEIAYKQVPLKHFEILTYWSLICMYSINHQKCHIWFILQEQFCLSYSPLLEIAVKCKFFNRRKQAITNKPKTTLLVVQTVPLVENTLCLIHLFKNVRH